MKRIEIPVSSEIFQALEVAMDPQERITLEEYLNRGIQNLVRWTNDQLELVFILNK